MAHSLSRVYIHGILNTKYRQHFITNEYESTIHQFILDELEKVNCPCLAINGIEDHVHVLFRLNPNVSMKQAFQQMKGGTSARINREELMPQKFRWQVGYGAFSVSEHRLGQIIGYIKKQKRHHKRETSAEEAKRLGLE